MRKRVVVTGMGCISPLGNDVTTMWRNLLAGKSGVGLITHYDTTEFKSKVAAEVKDFDPAALFGSREARRMDRFAQFALAGTSQAIENAGLEINDSNRDSVGVVIGSGIGGIHTLLEQIHVLIERGPSRVSPFLVPMMIPDTSAGMVAIQFGVRGPNMAVVTACATGTNAIGEATEIIRRGHADVVLAGGTEAAIVPIAMAGLGNMTALTARNDDPERASRPFDLNRDGFVMGEGAAILVLESLEHAMQRNANILAEVSGYGTTNDAYHISAPAESGAGAARCVRLALEDAGLGITDIDYINAHGTSTPLNDKSETAAIKTVFGEHAYQVPVSSTKSMTGHLLGASGALEAIVSVMTLLDGRMHPTINYETPDPECDLDYVPNTARAGNFRHVMSNSFGFGGHNATIILSRLNGQGTIPARSEKNT
ncbi:MAG: beta-ketoacyl-[acyl-carrier-protein] synthase II [Chloroflexi bacterium RBG_16_58_14]|nr:MAG: beta-ketoacyl-[acyl-carrier-protein] synthase II [Chloroflexi bacterium RBG_16_58_14]